MKRDRGERVSGMRSVDDKAGKGEGERGEGVRRVLKKGA